MTMQDCVVLQPADNGNPIICPFAAESEFIIGRGELTFPPGAAVEKCSRKQAAISAKISENGTPVVKITCLGLNPISFVRCQAANFDATIQKSLQRLKRGEAITLSDGDAFFPGGVDLLLTVSIRRGRAGEISGTSNSSDLAEVNLISGTSNSFDLVEGNLDDVQGGVGSDGAAGVYLPAATLHASGVQLSLETGGQTTEVEKETHSLLLDDRRAIAKDSHNSPRFGYADDQDAGGVTSDSVQEKCRCKLDGQSSMATGCTSRAAGESHPEYRMDDAGTFASVEGGNCQSTEMACLEGVVASLTGYVGSEKDHFVDLIQRMGGVHTGDLSARNTHLVCWHHKGPKYDFALRTGRIHIVNHQWIEDSMIAHTKMPESLYSTSGEEAEDVSWVLDGPPSTKEKHTMSCTAHKERDASSDEGNHDLSRIYRHRERDASSSKEKHTLVHVVHEERDGHSSKEKHTLVHVVQKERDEHSAKEECCPSHTAHNERVVLVSGQGDHILSHTKQRQGGVSFSEEQWTHADIARSEEAAGPSFSLEEHTLSHGGSKQEGGACTTSLPGNVRASPVRGQKDVSSSILEMGFSSKLSGQAWLDKVESLVEASRRQHEAQKKACSSKTSSRCRSVNSSKKGKEEHRGRVGSVFFGAQERDRGWDRETDRRKERNTTDFDDDPAEGVLRAEYNIWMEEESLRQNYSTRRNGKSPARNMSEGRAARKGADAAFKVPSDHCRWSPVPEYFEVSSDDNGSPVRPQKQKIRYEAASRVLREGNGCGMKGLAGDGFKGGSSRDDVSALYGGRVSSRISERVFAPIENTLDHESRPGFASDATCFHDNVENEAGLLKRKLRRLRKVSEKTAAVQKNKTNGPFNILVHDAWEALNDTSVKGVVAANESNKAGHTLGVRSKFSRVSLHKYLESSDEDNKDDDDDDKLLMPYLRINGFHHGSCMPLHGARTSGCASSSPHHAGVGECLETSVLEGSRGQDKLFQNDCHPVPPPMGPSKVEQTGITELARKKMKEQAFPVAAAVGHYGGISPAVAGADCTDEAASPDDDGRGQKAAAGSNRDEGDATRTTTATAVLANQHMVCGVASNTASDSLCKDGISGNVQEAERSDGQTAARGSAANSHIVHDQCRSSVSTNLPANPTLVVRSPECSGMVLDGGSGLPTTVSQSLADQGAKMSEPEPSSRCNTLSWAHCKDLDSHPSTFSKVGLGQGAGHVQSGNGSVDLDDGCAKEKRTAQNEKVGLIVQDTLRNENGSRAIDDYPHLSTEENRGVHNGPKRKHGSMCPPGTSYCFSNGDHMPIMPNTVLVEDRPQQMDSKQLLGEEAERRCADAISMTQISDQFPVRDSMMSAAGDDEHVSQPTDNRQHHQDVTKGTSDAVQSPEASWRSPVGGDQSMGVPGVVSVECRFPTIRSERDLQEEDILLSSSVPQRLSTYNGSSASGQISRNAGTVQRLSGEHSDSQRGLYSYFAPVKRGSAGSNFVKSPGSVSIRNELAVWESQAMNTGAITVTSPGGGSPVNPDGGYQCIICLSKSTDSTEKGILDCSHAFCFICICTWAATKERPFCPVCRAEFETITKKRLHSEKGIVMAAPKRQKTCEEELQEVVCNICHQGDRESLLLMCERCVHGAAHTFCLDPPLSSVPAGEWLCDRCTRQWGGLRPAGMGPYSQAALGTGARRNTRTRRGRAARHAGYADVYRSAQPRTGPSHGASVATPQPVGGIDAGFAKTILQSSTTLSTNRGGQAVAASASSGAGRQVGRNEMVSTRFGSLESYWQRPLTRSVQGQLVQRAHVARETNENEQV